MLGGLRSHGKAAQRGLSDEQARELYHGKFGYAGMRLRMALVAFQGPEQFAIDIQASERCFNEPNR
ncbi:hypothetical protein XI08_25710 [Bradyrhizobium sp. CCBAU 11361]|nr:hypothetical protein [Bradyrhizobium sp. CCBAU 11361]